MEKIKIEQGCSFGILWIFGWLFSIGFLGLSTGKIFLGIIIWPYYLGQALEFLIK